MLAESAHGGLYSLQDTRPVLSSEGIPLHWWDGGPAFTLASAGVTRLNFRGLYTYPPNAPARPENELASAGWHGVACNVSAWALCSADVSQVMPYRAPRMPERLALIKTDGWADLGCAQSTGKLLVSEGVYDLSACDILDEGVDLLYTPGKLYHRHSAIPLWKYWLCVGLAILLVRALSHNVQGLWKREAGPVAKQWPVLAASVALLLLALADGDGLYVTRVDQMFFWSTAAYVAIYIAIHLTSTIRREMESKTREADTEGGTSKDDNYEVPVFNVIVASLQLVAMRFYTAAETPYNLVLIGMLACRGWTKLLLTDHTKRHSASIMLDSIFLSLCIEMAFHGTRELLAAVLGVAFVAGQLLARQDHA